MQSKSKNNGKNNTASEVKASSKNRMRPKSQRLALEQRIVFDAVLPAMAADVTEQSAIFSSAEAAKDSAAVAEKAITNINEPSHAAKASQANAEKAPADATKADDQAPNLIEGTFAPNNLTAKEIIFIDAVVADLQQYIADHPNADVVLLDSTKNGLDQIAKVLAGRTGIESIHILSHGSSGELAIGNGILNIENLLSAEHAESLAIISQALTADADILIYGCNVAEGSKGQLFVNMLAAATGADIAASDDTTGSATLGADWDLEAQTGEVQSFALAAQAWLGTLDNVTKAQEFTGKGMDFVVIGNSELTQTTFGGANGFKAAVTPGTATSATLSTTLLPTTKSIEAVYLYWYGMSADTAPPSQGTFALLNDYRTVAEAARNVDTTAVFTLADNSTITVTADKTFQETNTSGTHTYQGRRADVTELVLGQAGLLTGTYKLDITGGIYENPKTEVKGLLSNTVVDGVAAIADPIRAWQMVIVYSDAASTSSSTVQIYDGLDLVETTTEPAIPLSGFKVPTTDTNAKLAITTMGGDTFSASETLVTSTTFPDMVTGFANGTSSGTGQSVSATSAAFDVDIISGTSPAGTTNMTLTASRGTVADRFLIGTAVLKVGAQPPSIDLNGSATGVGFTNTITDDAAGTSPLVSNGRDINDFGENDITTLKVSVGGVLNGASEKITITSGATVIDIPLNAALAGTPTITISGVTFKLAFDGSVLTVTNNTSPTTPMSPVALEAFMSAITYSNTAFTTRTGGDRVFNFLAIDNAGLESNSAAAIITVPPPPADTDGDLVPDAADIDDDNDGILDTAEQVPVTLGTFSAIPAGTYPGLASNQGLRISDTTGQYFVDIYLGPRSSSGAPVVFDIAAKTIGSVDSNVDSNEVVELIYSTDKSPRKFELSSLNINNILSLTAPLNATGVRDAYAFSAPGTWTPIGTPAGAVVTVNTANADAVGTIKINDPDGNNVLNNIGKFTQATALDATISDVLLNMAGVTDGHNVRFDFEAGQVTTSMFLFNSGGGNMLWKFAPAMTVLVPRDSDNDGAPDQADLDSDNDGISDLYESTGGTGDALADTNKDGTISLAEGGGDADKDGLMDIFDANTTSKSGLTSLGNTPIDTDGDTVRDFIDLDSDGDGIADTIEARPTAGYVPNDGATASPSLDRDGVLGYFDNTNAVGGAFGGNFIDPVNTDGTALAGGDNRPDYLDTDSDGDLKLDSAESGLPAATTDANRDGISDSIPGVSYANPDGNITNPQVTLANEVGDTTQVAYREVLDTDGDGIGNAQDLDDDNDGILDTVEDRLLVTGNATGTGAFVNNVQFFVWGAAFTNGIQVGDAQSMTLSDGSIVTATVTSVSDATQAGQYRPANSPTFGGSAISGKYNGTNFALYDTNNDVYTSRSVTFSLTGVDAAGFSFKPDVFMTDAEQTDNGETTFYQTNGSGWVVAENLRPISAGFSETGLGTQNLSFRGTNVGSNAYRSNGVTSITVGSTSTTSGSSGLQGFVIGIVKTDDADGDGTPNSLDLDSDNDGISDLYESTGGKGDALADSNKDGTVSLAESIAAGATGDGDIDNDGLMDIFDANTANNTGTASLGNTPINTDGDSKADYLDLDSDADGIADTIEARLTAGYVPNDGVTASPDTDKDGILGYFDNTNAVGGAFGGNFIDPVNTDAAFGSSGDTIPDYLDTDSDGDLKLDSTESGLPAATTDANQDGISDSIPGVSYANPDGNITNPQVTLANEVGDTTQVAYREFLDTDSDGVGDAQDIDDDNDGILDTAEQVTVKLDIYSVLAANTYIGQTTTGVRLSDSTGQYSIDIYQGSKTSAGLPLLFDITNKIIRGDGGTFDGTKLMELVYTTVRSPKPFNLSSTVIGNIQSLSLPTNDAVRDGYAFSEAGTWTPISTIAPAVVTVNTANADSVGTFKRNDPDGGNTITNIGQFSQVTAVDSTISDVITNMAGAEDGHFVRFDFDVATTTASLYVFNTGGANMNWRYIPSMEIQVDVDADGDGAFDRVDLDADNDGISDLFESTGGKGDALADTNKDGTISLAESIAAGATGDGDVDNDGLMDIFDADTTSTSKISGLTSVGNVPIDTDSDGIKDYLDLDSDGDYIADTIEARLTAGYVPNNGVTGSPDSDKDGVLGYFDNTNGAGGTFGGNFIDPVNTDGSFAAGNDTTPDYLDLDSDGDGKVDSAESGLPLSTPVIDANKDGMPDSVPNVSYANPDGDIGANQAGLSNEIGDNTELAYREFLDTDKDGVNDFLDLDDDNDGILDSVEENLVVSRTLDVSAAVVTPNGTTSAVVSNLLFGNVTASLSVNTINGTSFPTRINQIDVSPASSDFTSALFTPALGNPGSVNTNIRLNNDSAARVTYTLTLSQPVDNLVMHVALIEGARWQFTGSQHTESRVSGNASLTYASATRLLDNTNNTLFNTNGFASIRLTPTSTAGITVIEWTQLDDPNNTAGAADTDTFTFSFTQILADTDGDGVNNSKDLDSDNDGISDLFESTGGTGVALRDTNNDGTITLTESVAGGATGDGDIDNDGLMDIFDANTANITGTASLGTTPINTDGDSRADYLDLDSDGDGIADSIEARPTAGYVSYSGTVDTNDDLDNDGVVDIFDQSNGVGGTFGGNFVAPVNTDALIANNADTRPDYLDTDSDGDGKLDATESGLSTVTADANGDGIRDSVNASYANPDGAVTTTLAGIFANEVGDTSQVAFRELNLPPVAVTDTFTLAENTPTVINLLANDTDPNGDTLSLKSINGVAIVAGTAQTITVPNGTVTVSTTGVVTFTPATGYNGPVTFPYEVKDPGGLFAAGTVNITVSSVNDTPVAVADTATVTEDTPATGNVLANDTDADLATVLTVTQFVVGGVTVPVPAGATGGTTTIAGVGAITVKADGSYTFTPVANFNGTVPTITYTVNDGSGAPNATATSTLNITVTPVNDPPVAVNDTINATEDTPIVLPLLANDTDVDIGDILSLKSINGVVVTGAAQTIVVPNGTISLTAAGVATFTPNANFNGTVTFPYEIKDQSGLISQATVTINVASVNDAPVAANDNAVTDQNVDVSGNLLSNDTDVDAGTTLTVSAFVVGGEAGPFVVGSPYTIAGQGIITINANGSYTFDPDPLFSGLLPTITYTVSDGNGGTDTAELNIEVNFINTPPEVLDVTATGAEDSTGIVVTLDGSDVDGNFSTFTIPTLPPASQGVFFVTDIITGVTSPVVAGAPFDVAAGVGGLLTFVPGPDFNGTVVVPYIGTDASGADSTPKNITITVTPVNDAPIARDDSFTTNEDTSVVLNLLGNDTDVDNSNAQLSLKSINGTDITPGVAQTINVPNGVVNVTAAGVATFVPNANYNGPVAFDYVVQDPAGLTDTGSVNITVTAVNDTPVAAPETASTLEDTPATGNVLTNDSDIDGNPLTVTQFVVDGQTITVPAGGKGTATLTSGVLEIGSNGAYTFTPVANFNGPVPVATYTISDGTGTANATATSTLTLSVTPVNDAPVAVNDTITTPEDTPVTLNLIGNDTDIDGDTLTLKSIDGTNITPGVAQSITVPNGTVNITAAGVITFTPTANYNGPATFKYLVQDPSGLTSEGTVNITVSPVNDAPVLSPEVDSTLEDTPTTGNLIANDTDIDGNTLTVTQFVVAGQTITVPVGGSGTVTLPSGVIEIGSNGAYTFTPAANFNGAVPQVTYTVSDGTTSGTSTLGITVTPVNDVPVAVDDTVSVTEDTPTTLTLLTNDTDADGDTLTLKSINGTAITPGVAQSITVPNGTVTVTAAGVVSFTPALNYNGPATFDYVVQDGKGGEDTGTVNITVTPVNDSPVVAPEKTSTAEDTPATGNVLSNDSDVDGDILTITQFVVDGQTITVPAGGTGTATLPSGTLVIGSDGTYTFTPAANFNGVVPTVTYTVNDGSGAPNGTVTSTLELTVTPVNDAPVATPVSATGAEDATSIPLNLAGTDVDGTIASVTVTTLPPASQGVLQKADGTPVLAGSPLTPAEAAGLRFVPAANFNGIVDIGFKVTDNLGLDSNPETAFITITPVNDRPVATNASINSIEDIPADVILTGTDIEDGTPPTVTVTSLPTPAQGVLYFADGVTPVVAGVPMTSAQASTLKFIPTLDFNGIVNIGFTVTDSGNDSTLTGGAPLTSTAGNFLIDVANVNDAPSAPNVTSIGTEDTPVNISNLITGVTDADPGDTVKSATINNLPPATQGTLFYTDAGVKTPVVAGTPIPAALIGTLVFEPAPNYFGTVDTIKFTVTDQAGELSSPASDLVITIAPVNDAPVVAPDFNTVNEDTPATGNVLTNDSDIESEPLTVTQFVVAGQTIPVPTGGSGTATIAGVGELVINADGSYTFTPATNFNGAVPQVTYTVSDGQAANATSTSTLDITVTTVNDAPIATVATPTGTEDTPIPVVLAGTDTDGTIASVTVTSLPPANEGVLRKADGTPVLAGAPLTPAEAANLIFTPAPQFNGTVTPIEFKVTDNQGLDSAVATSTITIAPVNDAPVAAPDLNTVNEDTPATGNVLTNDSDIENNPLTVTQFVVAGQTITVPVGGSGTANIAGVGDLVINADGSYTFTPATNFNGTVPSVTYTVSDGQATNATSTSTLNITVTAVNDAPIATPATLTGSEDTNLPVNLAGTDLDGTIASVTVDVLPPASEGVLTKADGSPVVAGVALTPTEAATLIFKPALNFNGAVTPIEFKVTDNQGLDSATALVNISLSAANDAPIATPVTPIGDEDTPITINFGGTDVEDGIPATITITSLPPASKGVLYLADGITPVAANTPVPAGDLIFKPALNYNTATDGPLVIPFTVTDSGGLVSTPANASITINALNDAPTATPATLTGNEDTPITVSLVGTDVDGTITSVTVTELPPVNEGVLTKADGSPVLVGTPLTPAEAASLVFTPALNFNGPVTPIKFTVKDNLGIDSTPATSTITVTAVNDAPIATPVTPSGNEDTPITVNLGGTDVDGTVATVTVSALPPATKGVLYLADGTTPVLANVPLTAAQAASLIFTPAPNYNTAVDGPIVVPFTVTDNSGAVSTSSSASITVNDVNDVPVATSKSVDTPEDTNVGVNLSGTDIDGTVTSIAVTQLPDPAEGILFFADGVTPVQANVPMTPAQAAGLIFNPTANYNSTDFNLVEIKFTVTDEDGGVSTPGTFVIDIADANDSPVATAVSINTPEDTPVTITLNGTDVDIGDSVVSVSLVTLPSPAQGILYLADGTTLVVAGIDYPPGSFVFKPAPNFNGTVPPFNFTVKDTVGQVSTPVAINLSIGDVNDPPTAINAVVTATEDTPVSVSLVGNDIDGTIASVTITDVPPASQGVLTKADGTVVNANDLLTPLEAANLTFTPAANFNGPVTPISFTVTDDDGGISPVGTATLTVTPVNDPPVATPATAVGDEDTPITVALTGTDVEGPIASVTITSLPPADKGVLTLNGVPVTANQVLTPADAALLVFTPTPNSNGPATFTFTVTDSEGTTSPAATATVNVTPVNDAPVATPSTPIGNEDTPIPVSLTGTDVEGPIASVTVTAVPPASEGVLTKADGTVVNANDVLTPTEAASLIFTPAPNFSGPVTPISFTVRDSNGTDSPPATSTITVAAVNDPPVATPATAVGDEDTPITVALTGTDVEGPIASVTITSLPPADKGVLTLNGVPVTANQVLTPADAALLVFTPTPNSNGPATFTFTVTDSEGTTSPAATATVNVTPVNDAPVATPSTPIGNEDTPIPVSLTGTDVEGPIASVTVTAVPPASEGVLTKADGTVVNANDVLTPTEAASLIFTPAPNFSGPVTPISFTVRDSNGTESPPATSTITVNDVVNPPVATAVKASGFSDQAITISLTGVDSDGTIASITIKSLPPASEGVLTLSDGTAVTVGQVLTPAQAASLRFKGTDGFNGTTNIGFTVTDDEGLESAVATASLNIASDNGLFEQLVSPPLRTVDADGSSDGSTLFGASTLGFNPPFEPSGTPVTDGLIHTIGLVSQANSEGVFTADGPAMNEINSYSSDLNNSAMGTSQGLFVQHAVRGLPVTSDVNIFVQNAVRQSQIESLARHIGVSTINTATNAVTSLIMPFELGAPNHIETDFTVQGAFDNDANFDEDLKKKTSQVDNQEAIKTLSNTHLGANQDAIKMQNKLINPLTKEKQKAAASSFGKQLDMANKKLKSTRIFG